MLLYFMLLSFQVDLDLLKQKLCRHELSTESNEVKDHFKPP